MQPAVGQMMSEYIIAQEQSDKKSWRIGELLGLFKCKVNAIGKKVANLIFYQGHNDLKKRGIRSEIRFSMADSSTIP